MQSLRTSAEPMEHRRHSLPPGEINKFATTLFQWLDGFSQRKLRTAIVIAAMAMALRFAALPLIHIPQPSIHDEFSYLLGAETFAAGRVTNPTPAMWQHFETFHEIFQPTYMSKYPPGQAMFLALGWKLFGHPWYGVWISFGLFAFSLCWMLQGWVPPVYALFGTMLSLGQVTVFGYWMNSYWGGAVAATGGCLVLGALPRLVRKPGAGSAATAAAGMMLLANSRPYEGLILTLGAVAALLWWRHKEGRLIQNLLSPRIAGAFLGICACGVGWLGYYNYRVSGSAVLFPYTIHAQTYSIAPLFLFFKEQDPPAYRHEVMKKFWTSDVEQFRQLRRHPARVLWPKVMLFRFYCSAMLAFASAVAVFFAGRKAWVAAFIALIVWSGLMVETYSFPHYAAAGAGLIPLLAALGLRVMRWRSKTFGRALVLLFIAVAGSSALFEAQLLLASKGSSPTPRETASAALLHQPGKHLVFVRYAPEHDLNKEWVYNSADIDIAPIIWARDMGVDANRELIDYYSNRTSWLWEPDREPIPERYPRP